MSPRWYTTSTPSDLLSLRAIRYLDSGSSMWVLFRPDNDTHLFRSSISTRSPMCTQHLECCAAAY